MGDTYNMRCSLGYNYNIYKEHLPADTNNEGKEQMYAVLQKLVPSLRQMSYPVFMTRMKVFFGMSNLKRNENVIFNSKRFPNYIF